MGFVQELREGCMLTAQYPEDNTRVPSGWDSEKGKGSDLKGISFLKLLTRVLFLLLESLSLQH